MRKKGFTVIVAFALAGSITFSSCIGSFGLTNKLLSWNQNVSGKFVNELVFLAFCIVPVYEISLLADTLVLNTIEFWSGDNPVADVGTVKTVNTENGQFTVQTNKDGYHIQKAGEKKAVDLVFNKSDKSWSAKADGKTVKVLKFNKNNDEATMYLPNGKTMNVQLNREGVLAFKQVAQGYSYYAAR